jgi:hypothetical protein
MAEAISGGDARGTMALRRVGDSREEGLQPSLLVTANREMQSQSIVVSARGWLVVNPLGVATPTVGWKRAPLSAVAPTSEVISDKCSVHIAS